jgi:hypothetical protein
MTTMDEHSADTPLPRRDLLVRLAGVALSITGLTAFRRFVPAAARGTAPKWDERFELAIDFTIAPQQGYRYHRPYVAVWVEDATNRPVRTLTLWVNTTGRGPRYIRELRRWFMAARDGEDAGGPDLIATVSSATRLPGQYSLTWNGRDDRGTAVEQGTYKIFIEASREHGTYQLLQQELTLAAKPVSADLPGNDEIGGARVEYRLRK